MGHEFCPRCEANLTLQRGYDNRLPYWICRGCGEMLINPEVDTDSDIAWLCDRCGTMLNIQTGFHEQCGEWTCTACGFVNEISVREVYSSEDEYQANLRNPYRGLSDAAVLALSSYEEIQGIDGRTDVFLVRQRETGNLYIKKVLETYDRSVYEYVKANPIRHMPQILEIFEGSNCLIVLEEYIEGRTLEEILDNEPISVREAIRMAIDICGILDELHNLPQPIVHRDVKPANIIITLAGEVYLLDMNVAKWYDPGKADDTRYMGTMHYAAPEQMGYGFSASSPKSDIYAVGMLLNVMITGKFPKQERASGRIWSVIWRCISLEAEKRYTARELAEELRAVLLGRGS